MKLFEIEISRLEEKHIKIIWAFAALCAAAAILTYTAFLRYAPPQMSTFIFITSEDSRIISDRNIPIEIPMNSVVISDVKKDKNALILRSASKSIGSFLNDFPKSTVVSMSSPLWKIIGSLFCFVVFFGLFWQPMTKKFLPELK